MLDVPKNGIHRQKKEKKEPKNEKNYVGRNSNAFTL